MLVLYGYWIEICKGLLECWLVYLLFGFLLYFNFLCSRLRLLIHYLTEILRLKRLNILLLNKGLKNFRFSRLLKSNFSMRIHCGFWALFVELLHIFSLFRHSLDGINIDNVAGAGELAEDSAGVVEKYLKVLPVVLPFEIWEWVNPFKVSKNRVLILELLLLYIHDHLMFLNW